MEAAEEFINGWTFEEFTEDRKTQFAVVRALEIIGEATKNVPFEIREKYPLFLGKIWQGYGIN